MPFLMQEEGPERKSAKKRATSIRFFVEVAITKKPS
jgi:hypothetical protein